MPRPSAKKASEDKKSAHVAPHMAPQPMMPMHQGMPMQPQHQHRPVHQQQQFMPQMPMQQQQPVQMPAMPTLPTMGQPQQQQQQQIQGHNQGRTVDAEQFIAQRDAAIGRLGTILEMFRSFTYDYISQTNRLLGIDDNSQVDFLASFEHAAAQLQLMGGSAPTEIPAPVEEKKERKKRTHDPDAPKRPLTPYFLYMQSARSIIANDLGSEAPKGAVQEEGQRRWATMGAEEKAAWNRAYQYNLHLYNARVHSYKAGNMDAKNMSDEEAQRYADAHEIPLPDLKKSNDGGNDQDAIAQQLQHTADDGKTPKKGGARKRKSEMDDKMATPAAASPNKKSRRASGKPAEVEEPKKGGRGKKTKSS